MKRISLLSLALLLLFALSLGAAPLTAKAPAFRSVAAPKGPLPVQAFLASLQKGDGKATTLAPDGAPYGAHFVDVDWECVSWCQDDYRMCAQGCSACDQCSCQLAYCSAGCGVPFQGC